MCKLSLDNKQHAAPFLKMISFRHITDTDSNEFQEAMEIYRFSFPENERQLVVKIEARVNNGLSDLIVGERDGKVVFMALLCPLRGTDFILLDYIATAPDYRNQRIGAEFINKTVTFLKSEGKYLLLEVDDPQFGENREERGRRVRLYQRLGARIIKDVRYYLPPFAGNKPTEMILMVLPAPDIIDGALVRNLIKQIYLELYDRGSDDPLLNLVIKDIPKQVELI